MRHIILLIFIATGPVTGIFGQESNNPSDSLFMLNVQRTYYLNILKSYKNKVTTPAIELDFPYSNYHSDSKTLRLLRPDNDFMIKDSTFAILRIADWVDESYGSGGSDNLVQLKMTSRSVVIDSEVKIDSISKYGIFYLTINNASIELLSKKKYSFSVHRKEKTEEALLDYVTEYMIENIGYISMIITKENYK